MITADPLRQAAAVYPSHEVAPALFMRPVLDPLMLLSIGDQCIVSGTNFLTVMILGRACGFQVLGVYALAFSVMVILMAMQESLLIAPYTVIASRLRSAAMRSRYCAATLLQQLLFACAASLLLLVGLGAASAWGPGESIAIWGMLAIVAPFWLLKEFARRACFVEFNTVRPLLLDGLAAGVQLSVLCVLWVRGELTAAGALAAAGGGHAAASAMWWLLFRPAFGVRPTLFRRALRLNWGFGSWACVSRAADMLHAYGLHWLLAVVSGPAATGVYAAASALLAFSNPVLMGIGNLLAPETARAYAAGGVAALRRVVFRESCKVTLVTAAFAVFLGMNAGLLLNLTFGETLDGQVPLVIVLSTAMLVGMASFGADNGLRALARPAESFKASLLGLVVSLLVALALVGPWEAKGAAVGALVGNLASSLMRIGSFLRMVRIRNGRSSQ